MPSINTNKLTQTDVDFSEKNNINQWTNMPAISEELYNELLKEFDNERQYFFNDSYNLED